MSKESDLNAKADLVRAFVDQETPTVTQWNTNPTVLEDSLRMVGADFTDTDDAHDDLLGRFNLEHDSTGKHSAPSEWVRLSGSNPTPLFIDASQFQLVGNWTNTFAVADRVRAQLATSVFVIAAVKTIAFASGPNRTTITLDAPVLTSALSTMDTALERHSQPKVEPVDLMPNVLGNGVLRGVTIEASSGTPTQATISWLEATIQGVRVQAAPGTLPLTTGAGTGASRIDTGTWAAGTPYAVHLCTNDAGTAAAVVASLSTTAPVLPLGYTRFVHIGWIYTTGAVATNFAPLYQQGSRVDCYEYLALDKGVGNGDLAAGETDYVVNLAAAVPPGTRVVYVDVYFATATMAVGGVRAVWTEPGTARGAVPFPIRQLAVTLAQQNEVEVNPKMRQVIDANRRFVIYITVPVGSVISYGLAVTLRGWENRMAA